MLSNNLIPILTVAVTTLLLTACGGGGGGGGGGVTTSNAQQTSSSSTTQTSSSAQVSSSSILSSLDRANTPVIAGAYLDLLSFAKETAVTIVNGEYRAGLADGTYKDSCEGGSGSFDITVSNNGNRLIQKYDNCLLSITEGGKTDTLLLSGEESIISTHNENGPSVVNITWKNYTVKNNGEPPLAIDGSFIYEGLLYFNSQITYKNVTARIKINAKVNDGSETLDAKNVDFVFDYPAIFDLYEGAGFGYASKPDMLHIFTQKIATAKGSLWINGVGANFSLNTIDQKVTFSNEGIAKGYLDGEPKGFFIQWDKNNDALIDAGIFLTETEYPAILDQTDAENNSIYYTRYLSDYGTPYPKNHWSTGRYQPVALSRGATTEIDARELFTSKSGALLTYEINNESFSEDWEQIEAGRFLLKFPDSNGTEIFKLNITAIDINGNRSPVIEANVRMNDNLADFDNDGIPDYRDHDIDNDGIPNHEDQFDKDPTEHSDLDDDGIGDNADNDRDNDGTDNSGDAYPNDAACSKLESGDGEFCYLTNSRYNFTDKNGIAYFIQKVKDSTPDGKSRFIRFDTINKHFLSPTATFDWAAGHTYTNAYNPENHSVIISNRTHDGYVSWQHVYILQLENFTITTIDNSRNYDMYPAFHDYGYFVFMVSESTWSDYFRWTEVYDSSGKLISTSESEARAAPKDNTYFNLQHSRGVAFCDFSVSINSSGNIVKNGQYENRYNDNCGSVMQLSENGIYGFTFYNYSFSLYDVNQNTLGEQLGYNPAWIGNNIVYVDGRSNNLLLTSFPSQETRQLDASQVAGSEVYVSGKNILLTKMSGYQRSARLQLYTEDLQLIYDSAQF